MRGKGEGCELDRLKEANESLNGDSPWFVISAQNGAMFYSFGGDDGKTGEDNTTWGFVLREGFSFKW